MPASPFKPRLTLETIPGFPARPTFRTKSEAREARFSVRSMNRGGFRVFYNDCPTDAYDETERGAWAQIVGYTPPEPKTPASIPTAAPTAPAKPPCSVRGCNKPQKCRGFCASCYNKVYRSGALVVNRWNPNIGVDTSKKGCIAIGCKNDREKRGFCRGHRDAVRRHRRDDLLLPMIRRQTPISKTAVTKVMRLLKKGFTWRKACKSAKCDLDMYRIQQRHYRQKH